MSEVCSVCNWTNEGCLNVGDQGKPKWICHGCIKRSLDTLQSKLTEMEGEILKTTQDLMKSKQEVVDVKNKLIDSQDRLQASLLDHKKTLEELVEVRAVLKWATDNVWRIEPHRKDIGGWFCIANPREAQEGPTLYAALKSAWEGRDRET